MERNIYKIGKELFITDNEEIKEGDYVYHTQMFNYIGFTGIAKVGKQRVNQEFEITSLDGQHTYYSCKEPKVVLTTDQDLINDGVQAIDDEFLEWFVKNPSCEWVEISLEETQYGNGIYEYVIYKREIPKEEPKKIFDLPITTNLGSAITETMKSISQHEGGIKQGEINLPNFKEEVCSCTDECLGYLTKSCKRIEEPKQKTLTNDTDSHSWGFEVIKTEEDAKIFVETMENIPEPNDKLKKAFRDFNKQETLEKYSERFNNKENEVVDGIFNPENWGRRVVKQETLEEAANRLYPTTIDSFTELVSEESEIERLIFINGAKWQQEKCEKDLDAHLDVARTLWLQVVKENKKMYSEKEVLEIIDSLFHQYASFFRIDAKEYFLQFKKK